MWRMRSVTFSSGFSSRMMRNSMTRSPYPVLAVGKPLFGKPQHAIGAGPGRNGDGFLAKRRPDTRLATQNRVTERDWQRRMNIEAAKGKGIVARRQQRDGQIAARNVRQLQPLAL